MLEQRMRLRDSTIMPEQISFAHTPHRRPLPKALRYVAEVYYGHTYRIGSSLIEDHARVSEAVHNNDPRLVDGIKDETLKHETLGFLAHKQKHGILNFGNRVIAISNIVSSDVGKSSIYCELQEPFKDVPILDFLTKNASLYNLPDELVYAYRMAFPAEPKA